MGSRFRVRYQVEGDEPQEEDFEVAGEVFCDKVLRALGMHLRPQEDWPFAVASEEVADDADLAERAVRLHRVRAACRHLRLLSVCYQIEGKALEVSC